MVSSTSHKVSHGTSSSAPTRKPPSKGRPMVQKVDTGSPPPPARPVRRAAQRSLKERRTSALFEGGALDSQLSDSQYIRDLVQSDDKSAKKSKRLCRDSLIARNELTSTFACEDASGAQTAQVEPFVEMENPSQLVEEFDYPARTNDGPGARVISERLGAQSFLARLEPAEFVAMNTVAMVIEKYRRRLEETQKHLDDLTYEHFDLMNNCRRLEDHNARLRGALDEHDIDIPDEEESQYT
ncbi:hypothetical protein BN946_scf184920.g54 [Trametes cinnabarina]|uniref:Uncharacterized protein n=1 Tax=Pycnoporus cinnabarinus TaxID=5643 RepID=A0A060SBP5_PYCCI|nr:hypothetical protein BN946_scf184920.g54 [Trametes cinnabarina]